MDTLHKSRICRLSLSLLLGALGGSYLSAQEEDEKIFELNPFIVDGTGDEGYNASNTTSATRLNEAIKDLPMNIQALTNDLLNDVAATDVIEALDHVAGVEPTGDENDREINFRGINSRFMRRNGFVWYNPTDGYSTDRVEVVRGPSSMLYGQAEPGGLINVITKKPVAGNTFSEARIRVDEFGSLRLEADANFGELLENERLAFRLALMDDSTETWKELYKREKNGIYLTTSYKITDNLDFRIEFEDGEIDEVKRLQGMEEFDGVDLPFAIGVDGEPLLGNLISRDQARTFSGLDDTRVRQYDNISYNLEGRLFDNRFSYQLIHNEQNQSQEGHQVQGTDQIRYGNFKDSVTGIDYTNTYYVRAQRQIFNNGNKVVTDRFTGSYEFEPFETKQNLIFGYDRRSDDFYLYNLQERRDNGNLTGGPRQNHNIAIETGNDWSLGIPLDEATAGNVFKNQFSIENEESTDSFFVALSGKYLDERLHVLTGFRSDDYDKYGRNPNGNVDFDDDPSNDTPIDLLDEDKIDSYNFGVNYRINDRVNFYYNYSESFKAAGAFRITPERELLTPAIGSGDEIGFKFDTADRKMSGTISYYQMDFEGDQVRLGNSERDALDPSGLNGRFGDRWLSLDTGGKGAEIQLVANPTSNFRLQFGYGHILEAQVTQDFSSQANFNDDILVGNDGNPVDENGDPIPLGAGFVTIDDVVWSADGQTATNAGDLGLVGSGNGGLKTNPFTGQAMPVVVITEVGTPLSRWSRHNLNFVAKYTWSDGGLKGFSVGGTLRGRYDNFASGSDARNPDYTVYDLIFGYRKKFEKVTWNSQLNIKNVTDKEYFQGGQFSRWGDPRTIIWTNSFKF